MTTEHTDQPTAAERSVKIDECAAFLNISSSYAQTLAANGTLPGAKVGKEWVFLKSMLVEYLRAETLAQMAMRKAAAAPAPVAPEASRAGRKARAKPALS